MQLEAQLGSPVASLTCGVALVIERRRGCEHAEVAAAGAGGQRRRDTVALPREP